jgi:hypothetical protein
MRPRGGHGGNRLGQEHRAGDKEHRTKKRGDHKERVLVQGVFAVILPAAVRVLQIEHAQKLCAILERAPEIEVQQ